MQLVNVCVQVDHPERHVDPVCELAEGLAVIPAIDQIFFRVLSVVVPSVIWNVKPPSYLQVLQLIAELQLFLAFKHLTLLICFGEGGTWPENSTQREQKQLLLTRIKYCRYK